MTMWCYFIHSTFWSVNSLFAIGVFFIGISSIGVFAIGVFAIEYKINEKTNRFALDTATPLLDKSSSTIALGSLLLPWVHNQ